MGMNGISQFLGIFQNELQEYSVELDIFWTQDEWLSPVKMDAVIKKDESIVALVQVQKEKYHELLGQHKRINMSAYLRTADARFGVIIFQDLYIVCTKNGANTPLDPIEQIKSLLKQDPADLCSAHDIQKIFLEHAETILPHNVPLISFLKQPSLESHIKIDFSSGVCCFSHEDGTDHQFFLHLLGNCSAQTVVRYIPLRTLYYILQNGTLRMCGLAAMNDLHELDFTSKYGLSLRQGCILNNIKDKQALVMNDIAITSCMEEANSDDLHMWRLYGDNGKGVMLRFQIRETEHCSGILLRNLKYYDENNCHPDTEYLSKVSAEIEQKFQLYFNFDTAAYWRYFYKSYRYLSEKEVRLVVDKSGMEGIHKDWIMSEPHNIFVPVLDIPLTHASLPLRLKEIMLGPKCPEKKTNIRQIHAMILEKNISENPGSIRLSTSNIDNYR